MFQTKLVGKIKTRILCSATFFPEDHAVYEIMWKNAVVPKRPQTTIWRMHFACWVPKATNTLSEYVNLLFRCNNGCMNGPKCYVIRTQPVLLELYPLLTNY
jgi:hypothetical protein